MGTRAPGVRDRARKELVTNRCTAKRAWLTHRKNCYQCRPHQDDPSRWCTDGYDLARALHVAHQALRLYDSLQAAQQLGLFGTEEEYHNDGPD